MKVIQSGLAACLLLLVASCSSKPQDTIIGKWEDTDGTSLVVEFAKDGTFTITDRRNQPVKGKYTLTGDTQLQIDDAGGNNIPKTSCKVKVLKDEIVMSDFQSETRMLSIHEGKLLYSFPPGAEDGARRDQIKFKRVK